jgi:hypothetical protein
MNNDLIKFIIGIEGKQKQNDTKSLIKLMEEESGFKASLNGKIIGYGIYGFKYENGKDGVRIVTGFSPRKQSFTIYIMNGFSKYTKELEKLGKHKISSKCCLYINRLADIDEKILRKIINKSVSDMSKLHDIKST